MRTSKRADAITPSATLALTAKAKAMAADGADVCSFTAGEPDFPPPDEVREAAVRAVEENRSRYAPAAGLPELRSEIAGKLKRENELAYAPEEIVVTVGAKQAIFNAALALLDPGDEAVIFAPFWVSYPEQIRAAGAAPIVVPTDRRFHIEPDRLAAALTPKTRMVFLNSPNNPTGAVYPRENLEALAEVLRTRPEVAVVTDEIYEKIIFDGAPHVSILNVAPDLIDRTVLVNGFSKSYAVPGWRVGYAAGPRGIIGAMTRIQGHATSNAPTLAMHAMVGALRMQRDWFGDIVEELARRREAICGGLSAIEGISVAPPAGAFYALADISGLLPARRGGRTLAGSEDFALALLEEAHVATIPGRPFGAENMIRFSFATSVETIQKGVERTAEFVGRLERA
jgi:aspartate aminotransferase